MCFCVCVSLTKADRCSESKSSWVKTTLFASWIQWNKSTNVSKKYLKSFLRCSTLVNVLSYVPRLDACVFLIFLVIVWRIPTAMLETGANSMKTRAPHRCSLFSLNIWTASRRTVSFPLCLFDVCCCSPIRRDQVQTCRGHDRLSFCSAKQTMRLLRRPYADRQKDKQEGRKKGRMTVSYLVPAAASLYAEKQQRRRQSVYLARRWNVCVTERYADRVQITAG